MNTHNKSMQTRTLLMALLTAIFALSLTVLAIIGFARGTNTAFAAEGDAITGAQLTLAEDVIVKFHTNAGEGDYLEVTFNGNTTKITEHTDGVFEYKGVTPQYFNKDVAAKLYSNDEVVGEKTITVKGYLDEVLKLSYEKSDCNSYMQYDAMQELAYGLLNYGAAAQTYTGETADGLVNADLTAEQKELATKVTASDTDNTGYDYNAQDAYTWAGASVRFDYKLGLFFVVNADSAEGVKMTIDGEEVALAPYGESGTQFIGRYNEFNATDMNKVVEAKLLDAENNVLLSATYSIKSYVYSQGNQANDLAALVKATYAYGFAAVAYANTVYTAPTVDNAGSVGISNDCDYNFTGTKYATIEMPALSVGEAYAVATQLNAEEGENLATTTFTLNADKRYAYSLNSNDAIKVGDAVYTEYNVATFAGATYDVENGYAIPLTDASAWNAYGATLTVSGSGTALNAAAVFEEATLTVQAGSSLSDASGDDGVALVGNVALTAGTLNVSNTGESGAGINMNGGSEFTVGANATLKTGGYYYEVADWSGDTPTFNLQGTLIDTTTNRVKMRVYKVNFNLDGATVEGDIDVESKMTVNGENTTINGFVDIVGDISVKAKNTVVNNYVQQDGSLTVDGETAELTVNGDVNSKRLKIDNNAKVNVNGTLKTRGNPSSDPRLNISWGTLNVVADEGKHGVISADVKIGSGSNASKKGYLNITVNGNVTGLVAGGDRATANGADSESRSGLVYNFYRGEVVINNVGGTLEGDGSDNNRGINLGEHYEGWVSSDLKLYYDCNLTVTGFKYWVGSFQDWQWSNVWAESGFTGVVKYTGTVYSGDITNANLQNFTAENLIDISNQ